MDIVARLKEFISHSKIPVTQFADNARIPRPSLSQLLNGRNRKVSDEVITKIHAAYPQLNMMWFLFGEGEMLQGTIEPPTSPLQPGKETGLEEEHYSSQSGDVATSDVASSPTDSTNTINFSGEYSQESPQNAEDSSSLFGNESSIGFSDLTPGSGQVLEEDSDGHLISQNQIAPSPRTLSAEASEGRGIRSSHSGESQGSETATRPTMTTPINFNTSPNKTIVNIIIYYSDNSYESFTPEG